MLLSQARAPTQAMAPARRFAKPQTTEVMPSSEYEGEAPGAAQLAAGLAYMSLSARASTSYEALEATYDMDKEQFGPAVETLRLVRHVSGSVRMYDGRVAVTPSTADAFNALDVGDVEREVTEGQLTWAYQQMTLDELRHNPRRVVEATDLTRFFANDPVHVAALATRTEEQSHHPNHRNGRPTRSCLKAPH